MSNGQTTASTAGGGTSIMGLLGIAFVILKLTGVIDWSWWLVLLPFYGGLLLLIVILLVGALGISGFYGAKALNDKRKRHK